MNFDDLLYSNGDILGLKPSEDIYYIVVQQKAKSIILVCVNDDRYKFKFFGNSIWEDGEVSWSDKYNELISSSTIKLATQDNIDMFNAFSN